MNKLPLSKRVAVVSALVEGNSLRSTCRMTGVAIGTRDATSAWWFMRDLTSRLITRVQLTTDGHHAYLQAVEDAFESEIDYAQLMKVYGQSREGAARYSPSPFIGSHREVIR